MHQEFTPVEIETTNTDQKYECDKLKNHTDSSEDRSKVETNTVKKRSKEVKVTIEFPEESDLKSEQQVIQMLKEIYMEKIKTASMQKIETALAYSKSNLEEEN